MTTSLSSNYSLLNSNGLQELQAEAKRDPKNALRQAAEQFESVFLNQMLKTMREAVASASEDDPFQSSETKTFQGLLDQQWASQMSRTKGLGIADMIVRQLSQQLPNQPILPASASAAPATSSVAASPATASQAVSNALPKTQRQDLPVESAQIAGSVSALPSLGKNRAEFIETILPHARRAAEKLGVAPELIVAHAALETGWGRQPLPGQQGEQSFNLFGIKAGSRWNGKVSATLTTEYENGVPSRRTERFRAYDSYTASFDDYAALLSRPRFAGVKNTGSDAAAFAQALQSAGYATDPNYAKKLQQVASHLLSKI